MLQLPFKGDYTYFWLNHYCQLGHNISNLNLLQNMEASQTIKSPWCLLNGTHRDSWCFEDGKSSKEKKKITLYFRRIMSFQMLKDVFPGVFVREHVCVFVHVCMLIFTGHGCIVVVSFTTQFTKTAAWLS